MWVNEPFRAGFHKNPLFVSGLPAPPPSAPTKSQENLAIAHLSERLRGAECGGFVADRFRATLSDWTAEKSRMHKTSIGATGLALLATASLTWDVNATTLTEVGTHPTSPVQTVACWCGWLGSSTAALRGGRSYRCSCSRASALRAPRRMLCSAHQTKFYCEANDCHLQRWSMTCR